MAKKKTQDKGRKAVEKKAERLEKLSIQYVPASEIDPNDYNPNRQSDHDFELLLRSMEEDGFTQPIVVGEDRVIVDGEHRWTGWIVLNYIHDVMDSEVSAHVGDGTIRDLRDRRLALLDEIDPELPVVFTPMTAEQRRIATLRHNRARGSEDIELAAELLRDLRELGALDHAVESLMLDETEVDRLLDDIPAPEALADDEFGEAWEPTQGGDMDVEDESGTGVKASASQKAVEAQRRRERRIKEAKTEEEKEMARQDTKVFRLICIFSGDEAGPVKDVFSEDTADRVLRAAQYFQDRPKLLQEEIIGPGDEEESEEEQEEAAAAAS